MGAGRTHNGLLEMGNLLKMNLRADTFGRSRVWTGLWPSGEDGKIIALLFKGCKLSSGLAPDPILQVPQPAVQAFLLEELIL